MKYLVILFALALVSCNSPTGGTASEIGNPNPGGGAKAQDTLLTICYLLTGCHGSLTLTDCGTGIRASSNIDTEIGLSAGFGTFQSIIDAEAAGTIVGSIAESATCSTDIQALSCASAPVTAAYNAGTPTDFSQIFQIPAAFPASCGAIF